MPEDAVIVLMPIDGLRDIWTVAPVIKAAVKFPDETIIVLVGDETRTVPLYQA